MVLFISVRTTYWKLLLASSFSHAFLGTCVFLIVMWNISTSTLPGMDYHYLGVMLLTLMFRWQLAFFAINLVALSFVLSGTLDWRVFPVTILTLGVIPIFVAHWWYRFSERKLPNHFFIYIFVNAFFGAAVVILVAILANACALLLNDAYTWEKLEIEFFPFLPLMMFPEAFITGTLITLMVAFKPGWVLTFDDIKYLQKK